MKRRSDCSGLCILLDWRLQNFLRVKGNLFSSCNCVRISWRESAWNKLGDTYHGQWKGIEFARADGTYWTALKPEVVNRKWIRDIEGRYALKEWPQESPIVASPPLLHWKSSGHAQIYKEILQNIDASKRELWLKISPPISLLHSKPTCFAKEPSCTLGFYLNWLKCIVRLTNSIAVYT